MQPKGAEPLASAPLGIARPITPTPFPDRNAVPSRALRRRRTVRDGTSLRFLILRGSWVARFPGEHSLSLGTPGLHDESPLGFGYRPATTLGCRNPTPNIALRPFMNRNAVPSCSPRVPSLWRVLPWEPPTPSPPPVPGPQRGPVTCIALPRGRSADGTSLKFMILRRSCVARFPGEHSLSLGTPGLHGESPLGFVVGREY